MNYFPFHIGDYASATRHLSWEEDLAYRRLLDVYYTSEAPLPVEPRALCRLIVASSEQQREAVDQVLEEFFTLTAEGWIHARADAEIAAMSSKRQKARESALIGVEARNKRAESSNSQLRASRLAAARAIATHTDEQWARMVSLCKGCVRCGAAGPVQKDHITPIYQGGSDGIANLQPLCKECNTSKGLEAVDHRPVSVIAAFADEIAANAQTKPANAELPTPTPTPKKEKRVPVGTRLSPDWAPSEVDLLYAAELGVAVRTEAEAFRDHWLAETTSKATKADWGAAWRTWCRNSIKFAAQRGGSLTFKERDAANAAARVHEMTGGLVSAKPITRRTDALQEAFDATPRLVG